MRYIIAALFSLASFVGFAQQQPHYSQYINNQYVLNPALSGIENYTDVRLSYRNQWVGLEGAPKTMYFTAHKALGRQSNPDDALTQPGVSREDDEPATPSEGFANHHGIGVQLINDRIGPFNQTSANITYAYHLSLGAQLRLAAGFGIGLSRTSLDTKKLYYGTINPSDPSAASSTAIISKSNFGLSSGIWLYGSNFFVGASAQQLMQGRLDFSKSGFVDANDGKLVPHIFLTGGYKFNLSESVAIVPSVMAKKVNPLPVQTEMNLKFIYNNAFWAGASYRMKYGFVAMAGMAIGKSVDFTYSYDYSTTALNTVSSGTHELQLGFLLRNNNRGIACPNRVW